MKETLARRNNKMVKEITQENTTIKVTKDTRDKLMIRKIRSKAKNLEQTIVELIESVKEVKK